MATYRGGKGQRGGDYRKRDGWSGGSGQREFNKTGSLSPNLRRSNSPRFHRDYMEFQHRQYASYLQKEWRKVEQDLQKGQNPTGTVEYVAKTPTDVKDEELYNVDLKNREEKPASPD